MLDTAARLCEAYLPIGFASALAGRKTTENPGATRGFLFAPPTQLTAPPPFPLPPRYARDDVGFAQRLKGRPLPHPPRCARDDVGSTS